MAHFANQPVGRRLRVTAACMRMGAQWNGSPTCARTAWSAPWPVWTGWRVCAGAGSELPAHLATGIEGEEAAYFHLVRKGYQVVARRWSSGNVPGDVDLIAWQGSLLCFIEVKTRTARDATPAEAAVDSHKRRYAAPAGQPVRAPITAGDGAAGALRRDQRVPGGRQKDCVHFENAFGWNERRRDWD